MADVDDTDPVITDDSSVSIPENQTAVDSYTANEDIDTWTLSGLQMTAALYLDYSDITPNHLDLDSDDGGDNDNVTLV